MNASGSQPDLFSPASPSILARPSVPRPSSTPHVPLPSSLSQTQAKAIALNPNKFQDDDEEWMDAPAALGSQDQDPVSALLPKNVKAVVSAAPTTSAFTMAALR